MSENKYKEYITGISFIKPEDSIRGTQATQITSQDLKGLDVTIMYGSHKETGNMGFISGEAHIHKFDEVQLFIGTDTDDLTRLGGEVEFSMGEEGEKQVISQSTAITVPKGMPHLPAEIKSVDHPFIFMTISLASKLNFTKVP